jgi:hypothetical protein
MLVNRRRYRYSGAPKRRSRRTFLPACCAAWQSAYGDYTGDNVPCVNRARENLYLPALHGQGGKHTIVHFTKLTGVPANRSRLPIPASPYLLPKNHFTPVALEAIELASIVKGKRCNFYTITLKMKSLNSQQILRNADS